MFNLCYMFMEIVYTPPNKLFECWKEFVKPLDLGLHGFSREIHTNTYTIEKSQIIICFVSLKNNGYTLQIYGMLSNDIWIFLHTHQLRCKSKWILEDFNIKCWTYVDHPALRQVVIYVQWQPRHSARGTAPSKSSGVF